MFVFDNDSIVGRSLLQYGEWAQLELDFLAQLIRPGQTVLDVGANIGTHTVPFAQMVGAGGRVISFEPQRLIFQLLCANIAINDIHNVWAQNMAVGAESGPGYITALDYSIDSNNFGACSLASGINGSGLEETMVARLDALRLPECALIKADVEGGEFAMLRGAEETIERCQPILYLEHHDNRERVVDWLKARGYRVHMHRTPSFNPKNFAGNQDRGALGGYTEDNIVCFPRHVAVEFSMVKE